MAWNIASSSSSSSSNQQFPAEFRFDPYDWELIKFYLLLYIQGIKPPIDIPTEKDMRHPKSLQRPFPHAIENEFYLFTQRERKTDGGSRNNRSVDDGYWKTTSTDKMIIHENNTIGFKKTFTYYEGMGKSGKNTGWIMHEYRLNPSSKLIMDSLSNVGKGKHEKVDDIVLCRIHNRKSSGRNSSQKEADQGAASMSSVIIEETMTRDVAPTGSLPQKSDDAGPSAIAASDSIEDETFNRLSPLFQSDMMFNIGDVPFNGLSPPYQCDEMFRIGDSGFTEMERGLGGYPHLHGSLGAVDSDEVMNDDTGWNIYGQV